MFIVYLSLAFFACLLGAITGLGGGVIIKPLLDLIGNYDVSTINVLSSLTVFSMSIVSLIKQIKNGFKLKKEFIFICIGSIIGGVIGTEIFAVLTNSISQNAITFYQSIILAIILVIVLLKDKLKKIIISDNFALLTIGFLLGCISSFLGIGGGPINMLVAVVFLGMDVRNAAVVSIFIIFCSQFAKMISIVLTTGFSIYNLSVLPFMIFGAIFGGFIGANFNKKLELKTINKIFNIIIYAIIFINLFNATTALNLI